MTTAAGWPWCRPGRPGGGARGRRIWALNMVTSWWTWWRTSLDVHTARKGGAGGSWLRGESRRRWQRWAGRSAPSGTAGTGWGGSTLCMCKCGSPVWRMAVLERRSGECSERGRTLRWPFREQRRFGVGRARRVCHWARCSGDRWCGGPRPALPPMAFSATAIRPEARGAEEEGAGSVAGRCGGAWSWGRERLAAVRRRGCGTPPPGPSPVPALPLPPRRTGMPVGVGRERERRRKAQAAQMRDWRRQFGRGRTV